MTLVPLAAGDTPFEAYERCMRHGASALAARVAHGYGLPRELLIMALDRAMKRFEELGFPDAAVALAEELGFTVVATTLDKLPQVAAALERIERQKRLPADPLSMN